MTFTGAIGSSVARASTGFSPTSSRWSPRAARGCVAGSEILRAMSQADIEALKEGFDAYNGGDFETLLELRTKT